MKEEINKADNPTVGETNKIETENTIKEQETKIAEAKKKIEAQTKMLDAEIESGYVEPQVIEANRNSLKLEEAKLLELEAGMPAVPSRFKLLASKLL